MPSIRDARLQSEYKILSNYNNSSVEITPTSGNPPDKYKITYKCRGVTNQNFSTANVHTVRLEFPASFPRSQDGGVPRFFADTPLWHPNIWDNGLFCIGDNKWSPLQPISDLIAKIGKMIEFQEYNLDSPARGANWPSWMRTHSRSLPLGETNFWIQENLAPDFKIDVKPRAPEPPKPDPVITVRRRSPR